MPEHITIFTWVKRPEYRFISISVRGGVRREDSSFHATLWTGLNMLGVICWWVYARHTMSSVLRMILELLHLLYNYSNSNVRLIFQKPLSSRWLGSRLRSGWNHHLGCVPRIEGRLHACINKCLGVGITWYVGKRLFLWGMSLIVRFLSKNYSSLQWLCTAKAFKTHPVYRATRMVVGWVINGTHTFQRGSHHHPYPLWVCQWEKRWRTGKDLGRGGLSFACLFVTRSIVNSPWFWKIGRRALVVSCCRLQAAYRIRLPGY